MNLVTNTPILLSPPACEPRAERTPDSDHPSEDAPWQSRSTDGPTTICDVPQESTERRADYAGQPPEGSTIHRTGRAQKTTQQAQVGRLAQRLTQGGAETDGESDWGGDSHSEGDAGEGDPLPWSDDDEGGAARMAGDRKRKKGPKSGRESGLSQS